MGHVRKKYKVSQIEIYVGSEFGLTNGIEGIWDRVAYTHGIVIMRNQIENRHMFKFETPCIICIRYMYIDLGPSCDVR